MADLEKRLLAAEEARCREGIVVALEFAERHPEAAADAERAIEQLVARLLATQQRFA